MQLEVGAVNFEIGILVSISNLVRLEFPNHWLSLILRFEVQLQFLGHEAASHRHLPRHVIYLAQYSIFEQLAHNSLLWRGRLLLFCLSF